MFYKLRNSINRFFTDINRRLVYGNQNYISEDNEAILIIKGKFHPYPIDEVPRVIKSRFGTKLLMHYGKWDYSTGTFIIEPKYTKIEG